MKRRIALVCLSALFPILFCKFNAKNITGAGMEKVNSVQKASSRDTVTFPTPEISLLLVLPYPS